jgi:hypothetical protein
MFKIIKEPTEHRQGVLVKLVDAIQRLYGMRHEDDFYVFDGDMMCSGRINPKYQDELECIIKELSTFDNTEIGNLYLTSGGRIVLDRGWGEYFDEHDKAIFTLDELTRGMPREKFLERLRELIIDA